MVSIGGSRVILSVEAVKCDRQAFNVGLKKYEENVMYRLDQVRNTIHEVIPRSNIQIFKSRTKSTSKTKSKITNLRKDSNLFCRLYAESLLFVLMMTEFSHHRLLM